MGTTKTKTEADRYAIAAAELSQANAASQEASTALLAAEDRLADLRECAGGDLSVTASDLAHAAFEVELRTLRRDHAAATVKRVERAQPVRPDLAEAIRETVARVLRFPVEVVEAMPTEAEALPSGYLIQRQRTTRNLSTGVLSGAVNLRVLRTDLHSPLDGERLERELRSAGLGVGLIDRGTSKVDDGLEVQSFNLDVTRALEALPVMAGGGQPERGAGRMASGIVAAIEQSSMIGSRQTVGATAGASVRRTSVADGSERRWFRSRSRRGPSGAPGQPMSCGTGSPVQRRPSPGSGSTTSVEWSPLTSSAWGSLPERTGPAVSLP